MWPSAAGRRSATRHSNGSGCACRILRNSQVCRNHRASAAPTRSPPDKSLSSDTSLAVPVVESCRASHSAFRYSDAADRGVLPAQLAAARRALRLGRCAAPAPPQRARHAR